MTKLFGLFAALALVATTAQAVEMRPMQATSISLGEVTGIAFYTVAGDGFEVVATLAAGEAGTPMRVVATLVPGQKMRVSVPQAAGLDPLEVELVRVGDSLYVNGPAAPAAIVN